MKRSVTLTAKIQVSETRPAHSCDQPALFGFGTGFLPLETDAPKGPITSSARASSDWGMAKPSTFAVFEIDGYLVFRRRLLSLPEIKSGYIGDGDRQGLDSKECFQPTLPRAISAHPCSMTSECACRCNSPYTIAERSADGVRQIPRCDPCIPCGSNRSAVLHKRFAKVSEETSGDLEYRWT